MFKEAQDEVAAQQQNRKEDDGGGLAQKRQKQTHSQERRATGEREFEELVQGRSLPFMR